MRKTIKTLLILLVLFPILVSCAEEVQSEGNTTEKVVVKFVPNLLDSKAIKVTDTPEITCLSYKATPNFKKDSEVISGEATSWVTIDSKNKDNCYETGKVFTQGAWKFEVKVGNGEYTFYTGSVEVYLTGTEKTVYVDVLPYFEQNGSGTFTINVSSSKLSDQTGCFKVKFYDQRFEELTTGDGVMLNEEEINYSSFSLPATSNGQVDSVNTSLTFKPGIYFAEIQYTSKDSEQKDLSTEKTIVAFKVINKCTSVLTGNLDNGSFVQSNLGLQFLTGEVNETATKNVYKFEKTNSYPGTVHYKWFVNGNPVGTDSATYTFDKTIAGTYYLTCVVINTYNEQDDVLSITKIIKI